MCPIESQAKKQDCQCLAEPLAYLVALPVTHSFNNRKKDAARMRVHILHAAACTLADSQPRIKAAQNVNTECHQAQNQTYLPQFCVCGSCDGVT